MMLISQSVSLWITLPPTWESETSPSVYLHIRFKLLSAPKSLSFVEETIRQQAEIIPLDCSGISAWIFHKSRDVIWK